MQRIYKVCTFLYHTQKNKAGQTAFQNIGCRLQRIADMLFVLGVIVSVIGGMRMAAVGDKVKQGKQKRACPQLK